MRPLKLFNIIHESYNGNSPMEQFGMDHEDAAENYAEEFDAGDYPLISSGSPEYIRVVDEDGVEKSFKIYAEATVNYYADEIEVKK